MGAYRVLFHSPTYMDACFAHTKQLDGYVMLLLVNNIWTT